MGPTRVHATLPVSRREKGEEEVHGESVTYKRTQRKWRTGGGIGARAFSLQLLIVPPGLQRMSPCKVSRLLATCRHRVQREGSNSRDSVIE
jgi:hypothetical protein